MRAGSRASAARAVACAADAVNKPACFGAGPPPIAPAPMPSTGSPPASTTCRSPPWTPLETPATGRAAIATCSAATTTTFEELRTGGGSVLLRARGSAFRLRDWITKAPPWIHQDHWRWISNELGIGSVPRRRQSTGEEVAGGAGGRRTRDIPVHGAQAPASVKRLAQRGLGAVPAPGGPSPSAGY